MRSAVLSAPHCSAVALFVAKGLLGLVFWLGVQQNVAHGFAKAGLSMFTSSISSNAGAVFVRLMRKYQKQKPLFRLANVRFFATTRGPYSLRRPSRSVQLGFVFEYKHKVVADKSGFACSLRAHRDTLCKSYAGIFQQAISSMK